MRSTDAFHPAVAAWFEDTFAAPTEAQRDGWPAILSGRDTLIAAPTGSGKTLAAFLAAIDALVREACSNPLPDETRVLYISPLKALGNDVRTNLKMPLQGIRGWTERLGLPEPGIRAAVRSGDTPASQRSAMVRRPPHILVTTPESFYLLLTSDGGRGMLRTVSTVIVDEIHAVAPDKRGAHLALSLERLDALTSAPPVRIGLSATQRPIEAVGRFLVGAARPDPVIVDRGHKRALDLGLELPSSPLEAVMPHEVWSEIYDRLAELIRGHRTTLIFVNTRRMAERLTRHLEERLGAGVVAAHHGSLAKEKRLLTEARLKSGELAGIVATASLELGIDIGSVDLVCQVGTTRSVATLLQRVGRSGHALGATPKGRVFPLTRDELVEAAALLDAVRRGELDRLVIPEGGLDILAQQIVAEVASAEWPDGELYDVLRRAAPYKDLDRTTFDAVLRMLAEGFTTRRGRRGAYIHHDRVNGRLRGRRGARLAALTSGGAIPDAGDFKVVLEPSGAVVGSLNEDFAIESQRGDVFQLGNTSWRVEKIEQGTVRVSDAAGQPPTIPFWLGEAPSRTQELSEAVSRVRDEVDRRLDACGTQNLVAQDDRRAQDDRQAEDDRQAWDDRRTADDRLTARDWLTTEVGVPLAAANQIVDYLGAARAALGAMPTRETLVAERFFDEAGSQHLVLHAPFGSRMNRAWGLALRKRFCRKFNFELQAAATEDAIVLSLGPTHSFPVDEVFAYLDPATAREILVQALLDAPMFATRWRWNAARSLAILRRYGNRRLPIQLQRMAAEDLIAVIFPDQLACLENIAGDREIPDHPLVNQTIRDCLEEAMDIDALESLLTDIKAGRRKVVARDLTEPSPLAQEVISARPYAFLDDAPLEERRTQAVASRRWLDAESAKALGALDASAIQRVREEAWPDATNPDELHDALCLSGYLTAEECRRFGWEGLVGELAADGRAAGVVVEPRPAGRRPRGEGSAPERRVATEAGEQPRGEGPAPGLRVATERTPEIRALFPGATLAPTVRPPADLAARQWTPEEAAREILRSRMEVLGPVTADRLATESGLAASVVHGALLALETEGFVLRGSFSPGSEAVEWCDRRLLARIHRYTLGRLRQEIRPVPAQAYLRFLLHWQHLHPDAQLEGPEGVRTVLDQLEGYECAAGAWETEILPQRVAGYDPSTLDVLAMSGDLVWARLRPSAGEQPRGGPIRTTPVAFVARSRLEAWRAFGDPREAPLSAEAGRILDILRTGGAAFFADLASSSGILPTRIEDALGELVAGGLITADSFRGLRALLVPSSKRPRLGRRRSARWGVAPYGIETAGRWWALPEALPEAADEDAVLAAAWVLLRRYGVVFRKVVARETGLPAWRDLLAVLRRLEARGEIRGGRFVAGFSGEQYALPEAVGSLRRHRDDGDPVCVSVAGADPMNLVGILTPGERLPAMVGNRVVYRDGAPVAARQAGEVRFLVDLPPGVRAEAAALLEPRRHKRAVRAYAGHRGR